MRHNDPIFTVFGDAFVAERRDTEAPPRRRKPRFRDRWFAPLVMLLIAVLVGATIPAVAITANMHLRAIEALRWTQPNHLVWPPPAVGIHQEPL